MTPKNVVGHSDIAVGRKSDRVRSCLGRNSTRPVSAPGTTTPPAIAIAKASSATACRRAPTCWRRSRLYGYALPATVDDAYFTSLLRAFQMHFRPENYDGALDVETAAILYALNEKYPA